MRNALAYLKMRRLFFIAFVLLITHAALLPGLARADITHGLIGWWKFDEGTSTTEHDSSGNGHVATSSTTGSTKPQWVSGKFGNALSFDGSTSYVNMYSIAGSIQSGPFTISAWFKLASPVSSASPGPNMEIFTLSDHSSLNGAAPSSAE